MWICYVFIVYYYHQQVIYIDLFWILLFYLWYTVFFYRKKLNNYMWLLFSRYVFVMVTVLLFFCLLDLRIQIINGKVQLYIIWIVNRNYRIVVVLLPFSLSVSSQAITNNFQWTLFHKKKHSERKSIFFSVLHFYIFSHFNHKPQMMNNYQIQYEIEFTYILS